MPEKMLSATPVSNRFNDLKNQLQLAYEGDSSLIDEKLSTTRSIDDIFKNAQKAFNTWSKWEPQDRTTANLLRMLDFNFFEVLDSVTIARSRKHIEKYYDIRYNRYRHISHKTEAYVAQTAADRLENSN